jgi:hypothetical protein
LIDKIAAQNQANLVNGPVPGIDTYCIYGRSYSKYLPVQCIFVKHVTAQLPDWNGFAVLLLPYVSGRG